MYARFIVVSVMIGMLLGGTAVYFAPRFLSPHLPEVLQDRGDGISGPVIAKRLEGDRLLVTVAAKEGAILITFRKKLSEIDLLVEEGDTVSLSVKSYRPFMQDPELRAVRKADTMRRTQPRQTPSFTPPAEPTADSPTDSTTASRQRP